MADSLSHSADTQEHGQGVSRPGSDHELRQTAVERGEKKERANQKNERLTRRVMRLAHKCEVRGVNRQPQVRQAQETLILVTEIDEKKNKKHKL